MDKIKTVVAVVACVAAGAVFAGPRGGGGGPQRGPGIGRAPAPIVHRAPTPAPRHFSVWGHGGSHFWPGFLGGVIGGAIANTIVEPVVTTTVVTPTVVTTPVVTTPVVATTQVVTQPVTSVQNVWVAGCYVDQVQANGTVLRVWQPGHYEQRTVVVQ